MTIETSTLRPGILVHLSVTTRGNVKYRVTNVKTAKILKDGAQKVEWGTERTIADPKEHEASIATRSKVRSLITGVCVNSGGFGLLCPQTDVEELEQAIKDARALADDFNKTAKLTRISVYVLMGRIAQDDMEAVRAINGEVSELLKAMEEGIEDGDVEVVRESANKAKALAEMLNIEAQTQLNMAIEAGRVAAREAKKAEKNKETIKVDRRAIRKIAEARTLFLDTDEAQEVAAPTLKGRALDMAEA
jgi:hypothetical protein